MDLTEVKHIGYSYFHRFKMDDGSFEEIETTEEDYRQLGRPDPKNPTINGGSWIASYETPKFNTPSERMEDDTFCELATENGNILVKLKGKNGVFHAKPEDFINKNNGQIKESFINNLP